MEDACVTALTVTRDLIKIHLSLAAIISVTRAIQTPSIQLERTTWTTHYGMEKVVKPKAPVVSSTLLRISALLSLSLLETTWR